MNMATESKVLALMPVCLAGVGNAVASGTVLASGQRANVGPTSCRAAWSSCEPACVPRLVRGALELRSLVTGWMHCIAVVDFDGRAFQTMSTCVRYMCCFLDEAYAVMLFPRPSL
jgi:hypothetical protein